ncbi:carnosine N-methyltransferase isoform X2 [Scaptodrosophila lebanonensis]|uniref:carnosine N-methyltransferase n=1 Tax=Drosophila lebanonensis TaxID=7225 RepID=A0A6J2TPJ5_DROLE|nr:carnosine N-methyltransferase isoform X2 [Scaptodrosophila lebanonensis]
MSDVLQSLPFPVYNEMVQPFLSEEDEERERRHIEKVQKAFQSYSKYAYRRLNRTEAYLNSLSADDQQLLSNYRTHLDSVRFCIESNQSVIKEILRDLVLYPSGEKGSPSPTDDYENEDMEQAQSTLKVIARDWSADGALEREQSYKPIIDAIEEYYNPSEYNLNEIKILVPGAGLGRLTYELACRGYACEGNEFSYFMLIAANFVLNLCDYENKYVLYPWVHQYVNNKHRADQVAAVRFPDVCPVLNPPKGHIEMAAGDFLEVYKTSNTYNCVATCFFIDCANNVIDFIRTIYKILVPGGIWVNLGPLLYHYSDLSDQNSIEPTYEDLVIIMESIGFDILKARTGLRTKYAQNPKSMKQSEYESLFWLCRKPTKFENEQATRRRNSASQQEPTDLIVNQDQQQEQKSDMVPQLLEDNHFETEEEKTKQASDLQM